MELIREILEKDIGYNYENDIPDNYAGKFIQNRDLLFLKRAKVNAIYGIVNTYLTFHIEKPKMKILLIQ